MPTVPVLAGSPPRRGVISHVDELHRDPFNLKDRAGAAHDVVRIDLKNTPDAVRFELDNAVRMSIGVPQIAETRAPAHVVEQGVPVRVSAGDMSMN